MIPFKKKGRNKVELWAFLHRFRNSDQQRTPHTGHSKMGGCISLVPKKPRVRVFRASILLPLPKWSPSRRRGRSWADLLGLLVLLLLLKVFHCCGYCFWENVMLLTYLLSERMCRSHDIKNSQKVPSFTKLTTSTPPPSKPPSTMTLTTTPNMLFRSDSGNETEEVKRLRRNSVRGNGKKIRSLISRFIFWSMGESSLEHLESRKGTCAPQTERLIVFRRLFI